MPALTFPIADQQLPNFLNQEVTLPDFLKSILYRSVSDDKGGHEWILSCFSDYHVDDGGAPEITGYEIADCLYDNETKKGKVWLKYEVSYSFGCADIFRSDTRKETCRFEIDVSNKKLILFLTDHTRRNTVDEF